MKFSLLITELSRGLFYIPKWVSVPLNMRIGVNNKSWICLYEVKKENGKPWEEYVKCNTVEGALGKRGYKEFLVRGVGVLCIPYIRRLFSSWLLHSLFSDAHVTEISFMMIRTLLHYVEYWKWARFKFIFVYPKESVTIKQ